MLGKQSVKEEIERQRIQFMNGITPIFTSFGNNIYDSDVFRSAVHAIANNAAKLSARHVVSRSGEVTPVQSKVEKLLQMRPNPHMTAFDYTYKMVTQLLVKSNAFALIQYTDQGELKGFYPLNYHQVEFITDPTDEDAELYVEFMFSSGRRLTVPYSDVIHLRRYFNENDFYGESSAKALLPTVEMIHTTNEGIINAVKSSAKLRGLLKFSQSMMRPEDIKKQKNKFVEDYMNVENNGGIAALDGKAEFQELKLDPLTVDDKQMKAIEDKVYKYLNISESIVTSNYTEDEWNSFYESVLEPIAIQMSMEYTTKLFTRSMVKRGHEILFEANRLQYASARSKIAIVRELVPMGLLSKNEAREIFNLSPIEDGDEYIMSLNYVNAEKADEYQLGRKGGDDDDDDEI